MTELALFGTDLFGEVIKPKQAAPWRNALRCRRSAILDARSGDWQT